MPNTSDILFDTLERWGVDTIFGLPGDGINGLMEALRQRQDRIKFVLVRHEEAAAFAASAYAKMTGRLGACIATTGPGGVHLLNGLYDAKLDSQPVIAITGNTFSDMQGAQYQQEVNMVKLMEDVSVYNVQVNSPEHTELATDLACRTALARSGVAHLTVPIDVQVESFEGEYSKKAVPGATSDVRVPLDYHAPLARIEEAARILNEAERPVILAGAGARGAGAELVQLAEKLQAPVIKALLGKDVMPDEHPMCLGGLGLLGTKPAEDAMEQADAMLMIGTGFPYLDFLPKPGQARGIQIDVHAERIGLRYPVEIGLVGDSKATLAELVPMLEEHGTREWVVDLQGGMRDWWGLLQDRGTRTSEPLKPQVVAYELDKLLADDAVIISDSGTIATWAARYVRIRGNQRFTLSGTLASMAPGLPYGVAAQCAFPGRQVVSFIGDGGTLMLGSELATIAQHELPVKVVVIDNGSLGMIKWEQMVFLGNPSYGVELSPVDFAKYAESMGVKGWFVDKPGDVQDVLRAALAHDGPALVHAKVDPNEPPMPSSIKAEQAMHMAQALARGEPNRGRIGLTLFRDKVKDLTAPEREERDETRDVGSAGSAARGERSERSAGNAARGGRSERS